MHPTNETARTARDESSQHAPQAPGGAAVNRAATVATSAALGGAMSGALVGTVAGPVGAVVGAAVGAVAAGFAGNAVAESVDAKAERAYWQDRYAERPYVPQGSDFDDYGPAYGYGVDTYVREPALSFDDAEAELSRNWTAARGTSGLDWDRARPAAREAWWRVRETRQPGGDPERR